MKVEEFIGKKVNLGKLAETLDYSRVHVQCVLSGKAKAGKKFIKAIEKLTDGRITKDDLMEVYHARQAKIKAEETPLQVINKVEEHINYPF